MTRNEKINEILYELSEMEEITLDSRLQEDLGLDSLHMVLLLLELEDCFGFKLDEADMNPFELKTVSDIELLVGKYTEKSDEMPQEDKV